MHRKLITSLVGICVVAFGLLGTVIGFGYRPALGLDLRGGISVTLRPVGNDYTQDSLDLAVQRIRERVDSFGVGEPEILRQDNAIVVNLPGVNDQKQALELVKVTGKVYLRPVLQCVADTTSSTTDTTETSIVDGSSTTIAGETTTTGEATTTTAQATIETGAPGPSRPTTGAQAATTPPTTDPEGTSTTIASGDTTSATADIPADGSSTTLAGDTSTTIVTDGEPTTTTDALPFSDPTQTQVMKTRGKDGEREICQVGPSGGDGTVFEKDSAEAQVIGGSWGVTVGLKSGSGGEDVWNALASECFNGTTTCPTRRLAIELDGTIQSAPTVNAAEFSGNVQITGSFSKGEASQLAQVLNSGALPITLKNEAVESVSATLGKDSLRAALIAGAIGVALVVLFMVLYYRRLAVVVIVGLVISGALVYSATSLISRFYNGVLSLSGIAGLIVSIGVTIDSYVVFFERLKDEVRGGRSLRNSAQRGFKAAFRTILIADAVSLIGAAVLWYLSVGAVRGFAFYLGLSTVMDIFVAYFFTRPAVLLLSRSKFMGGSKIFGLDTMPSGAGLKEATT